MVHIYVPSRSRLAPDPKIHSAAESTQMTYFARTATGHRCYQSCQVPNAQSGLPTRAGKRERERERETRRIDTRLYDIHRARWEETIGCDQITPWILEAERPRICCKNSPWTTYRGWQNTHSARNQEKRDGERGRERERVPQPIGPALRPLSLYLSLIPTHHSVSHPSKCIDTLSQSHSQRDQVPLDAPERRVSQQENND